MIIWHKAYCECGYEQPSMPFGKLSSWLMNRHWDRKHKGWLTKGKN